VIAKVIYAEEQFETWVDDAGEHLKHRPVLAPQSPMIGAYAYATGNDGRLLAMVALSIADIEARRAYSRRANAGAWVEHYEAMARKTAILALAPFLPLSPEQAGIFEPADATPMFEDNGGDAVAFAPPQAPPPVPEPAPTASDTPASGSAAASSTRSQRRAPVPA
jgi:recombinational DNA repair protein RecT